MAFTLVADIFAKVDRAITSMVSANVATIISDVTPLIATCLTIKLMVQGCTQRLIRGGRQPEFAD